MALRITVERDGVAVGRPHWIPGCRGERRQLHRVGAVRIGHPELVFAGAVGEERQPGPVRRQAREVVETGGGHDHSRRRRGRHSWRAGINPPEVAVRIQAHVRQAHTVRSRPRHRRRRAVEANIGQAGWRGDRDGVLLPEAAVGVEHDAAAIGEPGRARAVQAGVGQPCRFTRRRTVGGERHAVELGGEGRQVASEDEPAAVGRQRGIGIGGWPLPREAHLTLRRSVERQQEQRVESAAAALRIGHDQARRVGTPGDGQGAIHRVGGPQLRELALRLRRAAVPRAPRAPTNPPVGEGTRRPCRQEPRQDSNPAAASVVRRSGVPAPTCCT